MPAFITSTSSGDYVVRIGAPLRVEDKRAGRSAWDALGAAYFEEMKNHILAHPDQWVGWYDRSSWTPHAVPGAQEPARA